MILQYCNCKNAFLCTWVRISFAKRTEFPNGLQYCCAAPPFTILTREATMAAFPTALPDGGIAIAGNACACAGFWCVVAAADGGCWGGVRKCFPCCTCCWMNGLENPEIRYQYRVLETFQSPFALCVSDLRVNMSVNNFGSSLTPTETVVLLRFPNPSGLAVRVTIETKA